jgi:hypothetical protein
MENKMKYLIAMLSFVSVSAFAQDRQAPFIISLDAPAATTVRALREVKAVPTDLAGCLSFAENYLALGSEAPDNEDIALSDDSRKEVTLVSYSVIGQAKAPNGMNGQGSNNYNIYQVKLRAAFSKAEGTITLANEVKSGCHVFSVFMTIPNPNPPSSN